MRGKADWIALMRDAEKGRMLRRSLEAKLKETRLEIRALKMEERAVIAEMELEQVSEGPKGFKARAEAARANRAPT